MNIPLYFRGKEVGGVELTSLSDGMWGSVAFSDKNLESQYVQTPGRFYFSATYSLDGSRIERITMGHMTENIQTVY